MALALIIEDHAMNRKLMRDILEMNLEVAEAESAEQARGLLSRQRPDLILMDLKLPGMDGLTFLSWLKSQESTRATPVVVISAHAMPEDIEQALACGCVEYVTKPILEDPIQFAERMARHAGGA